MANRMFTLSITVFFWFGIAAAQETAELSNPYYEKIPFQTLTVPLSTNITLSDPGLYSGQSGAMVINLTDFIPVSGKSLSGWQLIRWQRDFIKENNFRAIPADATLADSRIMAHALADKNQMNLEFYHSNVLMNQRRVGNTQLQRMNVRMRGIPYVDVSAFSKLVDFYIFGDHVSLASPSTQHLNNIR